MFPFCCPKHGSEKRQGLPHSKTLPRRLAKVGRRVFIDYLARCPTASATSERIVNRPPYVFCNNSYVNTSSVSP